MLELKIGKQEFEFPSEWSEVTLRNYIDIITISEDKGLTGLDGFIKTLSLLCGRNEIKELLEEISLENFEQIRASFDWLRVDPKAPKKKQEFFMIGNEKWTIKDNFNKLTVGESITAEIMLKDKKMDLNPLEIGFGVLFRRLKPDGTPEKLNPDDISKIINEHSKKIMIEDVYNILSFFLPGGKKSSSSNTKDFSISVTSKIQKKKSLRTSK